MRARLACWVPVLALVACGPTDGAFVEAYADRTCTLLFTCQDAAALAFDGIDSFDTCLATYGPPLDSLRGVCEFDRVSARTCLDALEVATCPKDGAPFESIEAPECSTVFHTCEEAADASDA